jgi:Flp pilus assembly protein TadD
MELQQILLRNPSDCRALISLAELFERNGFYKRAVNLLRKVLTVFPRHPRCRSFLGDCLVKNKEFEV